VRIDSADLPSGLNTAEIGSPYSLGIADCNPVRRRGCGSQPVPASEDTIPTDYWCLHGIDHSRNLLLAARSLLVIF